MEIVLIDGSGRLPKDCASCGIPENIAARNGVTTCSRLFQTFSRSLCTLRPRVCSLEALIALRPLNAVSYHTLESLIPLRTDATLESLGTAASTSAPRCRFRNSRPANVKNTRGCPAGVADCQTHL